jgi:hypothetical protein
MSSKKQRFEKIEIKHSQELSRTQIENEQV